MPELLCEKIRYYRKQKGYSQEKLAEKTDLSKMSIRRYETGERQPRIEQLHRIAEALDVRIWDLLGMSKQDAVLMYGVEAWNTTPYNIDELSSVIKKDIIYENNLKQLTKAFNDLNNTGQKEAVKRVKELTFNPEYKAKAKTNSPAKPFKIEVLNAAHERTDIEITDEMRKHDDAIMEDDSEWE